MWASTVYAWHFLENSFDGLIAIDPYTHWDEPWLATEWSYMTAPGGMDVTFDLRLTAMHGAPVKWQDGKAITASDVEFSWDFLKQYEIPQYWGAFRFYDSASIMDADTITAHLTTTSQWLMYDLSGAALLAPPQVWTVDPRDGLPWTGLTEITTFDPSALPYPDPDGAGPRSALPTHAFGTGPYILQHSTNFIAVYGNGDLSANRNYWMTTDDIMNKIENMFHTAGDAVDNDVIDRKP